MAKPEHTPQWRRLTPEARRETILEVAARHFSEKPYDQVSTVDIAADAGVNRGLIHHYVGTKRELYLQVLRHNLHIPNFPPLMALTDTADLAQALSDGINTWLDDIERAPGPWLVLLRASAGAAGDPEIERVVAEAREAAIDDAMQLRFAGVDAPPVVRGLMASIGALALHAATIEWLDLGRLTRAQTHALILRVALTMWSAIDELIGAEPPQPQARAASS